MTFGSRRNGPFVFVFSFVRAAVMGLGAGHVSRKTEPSARNAAETAARKKKKQSQTRVPGRAYRERAYRRRDARSNTYWYLLRIGRRLERLQRRLDRLRGLETYALETFETRCSRFDRRFDARDRRSRRGFGNDRRGEYARRGVRLDRPVFRYRKVFRLRVGGFPPFPPFALQLQVPHERQQVVRGVVRARGPRERGQGRGRLGGRRRRVERGRVFENRGFRRRRRRRLRKRFRGHRKSFEPRRS